MSLIFSPMSIGFMSHVDFKIWQCRPVEFKGQGPFCWDYGDVPSQSICTVDALPETFKLRWALLDKLTWFMGLNFIPDHWLFSDHRRCLIYLWFQWPDGNAPRQPEEYCG